MKRKMWVVILIVIAVLAIGAFVFHQYIGALASGWGNGQRLYSWNLTVNSYDELIENPDNHKYLATIFATRLQASGGMQTRVDFDTVTREDIKITVVVDEVWILEDATEESLDPWWRSKVDIARVELKVQDFDLTKGQRELINEIIKERVTYIEDESIAIVDNLDTEKYTVSLGGKELDGRDSHLAMGIFLKYLDEQAFCPVDAYTPFRIISGDYGGGGAWWNPIVDRRERFAFTIKRNSDDFLVSADFNSSVYHEDEFRYTENEFEYLKSLIQKYTYPLQNTKTENIRLLYGDGFLLTAEETKLINEAISTAWYDGDARHMSGADYAMYQWKTYPFYYEPSGEILFMYNYHGAAFPTNDCNSGRYVVFSDYHKEQIEAIIKKYCGDDALAKPSDPLE